MTAVYKSKIGGPSQMVCLGARGPLDPALDLVVVPSPTYTGVGLVVNL